MHLILHIGFAKTGSSALQKFLYSNQLTLKEDGILLFKSIGFPNNIDLAAYFSTQSAGLRNWKRRRGLTNESTNQYFEKMKFSNVFEQEIADAGPGIHTAVITSEHLGGIPTAAQIRLHAWLSARFTKVTVVAYVRPQRFTLPSYWSTTIRTGGTRSLGKHVSEVMSKSRLDYAERLSHWDKTFGFESLKVVRYRSERDWDVRQDFAEKFLDGANGLVYEKSRENPSLGWSRLNAMRLVNRFAPLWRPGKTVENPANLKLRKLTSLLNGAGAKKPRLNPTQEKAVIDRYKRSNLVLSERYLGGEDFE